MDDADLIIVLFIMQCYCAQVLPPEMPTERAFLTVESNQVNRKLENASQNRLTSDNIGECRCLIEMQSSGRCAFLFGRFRSKLGQN